jgi:hypothetical protein
MIVSIFDPFNRFIGPLVKYETISFFMYYYEDYTEEEFTSVVGVDNGTIFGNIEFG